MTKADKQRVSRREMAAETIVGVVVSFFFLACREISNGSGIERYGDIYCVFTCSNKRCQVLLYNN
jgi:hypothetical protein